MKNIFHFNRFRLAQILLALLVLFLSFRFYHHGKNEQLCLLVLLLKITGLFASWALMLGSLRAPFFERFCPRSPRFDCHRVIESPAGTFFNLIHTADMGVLYFGGSLLVMLLSAFTPHFYHNVILLAFINILALPYTFFSVGYQALVVKKWCALCLIVQAVFWLEFWQFFPFIFQNPIQLEASLEHLTPFIVGYGLPLALWPLIRQLAEKAYPTEPRS